MRTTPAAVGPPVLVGVDGTETSLHAVEWAAAEARLRRVPLRIVHVAPAAARVDGHRHATDLLARAYTVAHRGVPDATVHTELLVGDPMTTLAGASAGACQLVVGIIGERLGGIVLGSMTLHLSDTAPCPVTIVRGEKRPATAPVVVGVDNVAADAAAIELAFADANRHESGLIVLRAFHAPVAARSDAVAALRVALGPWRERYPEVEVEARVVPGSAVDELLHAGSTGRLIVVGSRGRGAATRLLLGSTSRSVVRLGRCPVTIVRAGLAADSPAASTGATQSRSPT